jgi:septum formation protein
VQERGAVLVDKVEGDFYTVVGLPVAKVCRVLSEMGYDIWKNGDGA